MAAYQYIYVVSVNAIPADAPSAFGRRRCCPLGEPPPGTTLTGAMQRRTVRRLRVAKMS